MKRRLANILLALALAVPLSACTLGTLSEQDFDRAYPIARVNYLKPSNLRDALHTFRSEAGGPIRMSNLHLSPKNASAQVAVSGDTDFDSFTLYDGRFLRTPLKTSGRSERERLFSEEDIPIDKLGDMALQALQALAIPDAHVEYVSVSYSSHVLTVRVNISSLRRQGAVEFDRFGTIVRQDER